jgi:GxxExxY protein
MTENGHRSIILSVVQGALGMVKEGREIASAEAESKSFDTASGRTIGAAIAVHRALGPGFVESLYQNALCVALTNRGIPYQTQKLVSVAFEGTDVGVHKLDLVVDQTLVVELKAVRCLNDVHERQVRSYLKASNLKVWLLLNFNAAVLVIKRVVN